ncbi:MAG: DUF3021 family protein [Clostridia bacterium]|nr:DUF3021 family protein [Clostridia bacterium]
MNMKANKFLMIFTYMMVGIAFGAIAITMSLYINYGMTDFLKEILVWLIAAAILGLVSIIYDIDHFNDITATLIHAPVSCVVALISGWILDYGDGSVSLLLMRMLPTIISLYIIIHVILFLIRRISLRDINNHLKK